MANTRSSSSYEIVVDVDANSAIAELEKLKNATDRVGKAAKDGMKPAIESASKSVAAANEAAKKQAEQFNKNLAAAAALGGAFSSLSAQLGPMGQALGAAASGAGALYAAMGPMGAVIGAVAGALPALVTGILEASQANERAASSQARWTREMVEARARLTSLTEAIERSRQRADAFRNTLTRGFFEAADVAGLEAQIAAAQLRATTLREQATRAQQRGNVRQALSAEGDVAALEGRLTVLNLALDEARAKEAAARDAAKFEPETPDTSAADAAAREREEQRRAAKQKLLDLERMIVDEAARLALEESAALKEIERRRIAEEDILRIKRDQADINAKAAESARLTALEEEERTQKLTQSAKDGADLERERTQIEEDRIRVTSRATAGMEGVLDIAQRTAQIQKETNASFGEAFKTAVDEWLKGFALQEAYKGVAATAEAIGSAVTNQPNAAAKFAEAGIHFALAAAAGGASAAIPNGGGGGGGGGGGRRQGPEAVGGGASGGGGGTIVVNFNAPVAEAEIGRQQERAARAARRRFGS